MLFLSDDCTKDEIALDDTNLFGSIVKFFDNIVSVKIDLLKKTYNKLQTKFQLELYYKKTFVNYTRNVTQYIDGC